MARCIFFSAWLLVVALCESSVLWTVIGFSLDFSSCINHFGHASFASVPVSFLEIFGQVGFVDFGEGWVKFVGKFVGDFLLEWIYFLPLFKFPIIIFLFMVLSYFLLVFVEHFLRPFLCLCLVLFRCFFLQRVSELVEQWQLILSLIIYSVFV